MSDNGTRFFNDMRLVNELRMAGDNLSVCAADALQWLRQEMIDPAEYMRVVSERNRLMAELTQK